MAQPAKLTESVEKKLMHELELAREQAKKCEAEQRPLPEIPNVQTQDVHFSIEKHIENVTLRQKAEALAREAAASHGYTHAEVVGTPTSQTSGSGGKGKSRTDAAHFTVRLNQGTPTGRTIHIYIAHTDGMKWEKTVAARNKWAQDRKRPSYPYENVIEDPANRVPWDKYKDTPLQLATKERSQVTEHNAKAADKLKGIRRQIEDLEKKLADLHNKPGHKKPPGGGPGSGGAGVGASGKTTQPDQKPGPGQKGRAGGSPPPRGATGTANQTTNTEGAEGPSHKTEPKVDKGKRTVVVHPAADAAGTSQMAGKSADSSKATPADTQHKPSKEAAASKAGPADTKHKPGKEAAASKAGPADTKHKPEKEAAASKSKKKSKKKSTSEKGEKAGPSDPKKK